MSETIRIAIDAMGGDFAPMEIVKGTIDAAAAHPELDLILVGQEDVVRRELKAFGYNGSTIRIQHASEVISTEEAPVAAIRSKTDSSIVVGARMVKNGEADAFISAGSTGALLTAGTLIVGRIRGVDRPPIAAVIPTKAGATLLLDSGANVDAKPSQLVQFARMGSLYAENVLGVANPRIGLLNIGVEEEKGSAAVKETYALLKEIPELNFIGNVEARDVSFGPCDVLVADAFAGNVVLKMYEGVASMLLSEVKSSIKSNPVSMLGGALIQGTLKKTLKKFDAKIYGGAPLLGCNGLVVKTHGTAKAIEVANTIEQCRVYVQSGTTKKMKECFEALRAKSTQ